MSDSSNKQLAPWQVALHEIVFEADTVAGRIFDVALILVILLSVATVMLESIGSVARQIGTVLFFAEWFFTILFTIEYVLRLSCVLHPRKYALSFFGLVDLLAVIPTYLSLFVAGSQYFVVIRTLRMLRIFRVLKLAQYLSEANVLLHALRSSRRKIAVFLWSVLIAVTILGSMMYLIEKDQAGFTSIPRSIYWAIVTLTTVGYGDISPQTDLGQCVAAIVMLIGYAILAVPTGIVAAEVAQSMQPKGVSTQACPACSREGHHVEAEFCWHCGGKL